MKKQMNQKKICNLSQNSPIAWNQKKVLCNNSFQYDMFSNSHFYMYLFIECFDSHLIDIKSLGNEPSLIKISSFDSVLEQLIQSNWVWIINDSFPKNELCFKGCQSKVTTSEVQCLRKFMVSILILKYLNQSKFYVWRT